MFLFEKSHSVASLYTPASIFRGIFLICFFLLEKPSFCTTLQSNFLQQVTLLEGRDEGLSASFPSIHADSVYQLLSGVKYAIIELTPQEQQMADLGKYILIERFAYYLEQMGFREVAYRTVDKTRLLLSVPTYCDLLHIRFQFHVRGDSVENLQFSLQNCRKDKWIFTHKEKFVKDKYFFRKIESAWKKFYSISIPYDVTKRLELNTNAIITTKADVLNYLKENVFRLDSIEGIYEKVPDYQFSTRKHTLAILKNRLGTYNIIYLDGASNYLDWKEGEWMGELSSNSQGRMFEQVKWTTPDKALKTNGNITCKSANSFQLRFKNHPNVYTYKRVQNTLSISNTANLSGEGKAGTGFLIDKKGLVLTNYHLVAKAKNISVIFPNNGNGNPNPKNYNVALVASDLQADLAILKISEEVVTNIPSLPYGIREHTKEVGEQVFTLGYPLVSSMGIEPKLAVGTISSLSGYQNSPSNYLTTVAVYAGNSGSPLFDESGNVIGILRNKHSDASKASYVLKSPHILDFLTSTGLFQKTDFAAKDNLMNLPLTEQVKSIQPFVVYIRAY